MSSNTVSQGNSRPGSSSATNLRPRGKRMITGLEEFGNVEDSTQLTATPFDSPFQSRAASPIPSKHPSRTPSAHPEQRKDYFTAGNTPPRQTQALGNDLAQSLSGLWGKSWTSLQGIASNVLGNDPHGEIIKDKSPQRQRRPFEATHPRANSQKKQWGPPTVPETQPGGGSKEERQAMIRAKKRQELLMENGNLTPTAAKFKRRTSDDLDSTSIAPSENDDRDVLVYIHPVNRDDTVAGVTIKYNCSLALLKKANRLWSNDAIQTRKTLVIPVDACGVRGEVVPGPDPQDDTSKHDGAAETRIPEGPNSNPAATTISPALSASNRSTSDQQPTWRHDSWVKLPHSPDVPVEIARMSRSQMSYFPRNRRKSMSYSDVEAMSAIGSPAASFEVARSRPSVTFSDSQATSADPKTRTRRSSSASQQWASKLMGPGGVGSLTGKGPSAPGPAEDKLNKTFKKHLPSIVPPPPPAAWEEDDYVAAQGPHTGGLENFGGAIEGWVKKMARSASTAIEQGRSGALRPALGVREGSSAGRAKSAQGRVTNPALGMSSGGGDLIELTHAFELAEDDVDEDELDRGRLRSGPSSPGKRKGD